MNDFVFILIYFEQCDTENQQLAILRIVRREKCRYMGITVGRGKRIQFSGRHYVGISLSKLYEFSWLCMHMYTARMLNVL